MTFAPGEGVVREVRNGGHYLVELKGRSIVAAETQLSAVSPRKRHAASHPLAAKARLGQHLASRS